MFTIIHDKPTCIGCGACCSVSDEWEMEDTKAVCEGMEYDAQEQGEKKVEKKGSHMDAAEVCPVNCIHLKTEDGEELI